MKGDFSRPTFNPVKHYTRVLMQQGRVHLDADWNEQADIQAYYLRSLAVDLIGPHGGPLGNCGFEISATDPLEGERRSESSAIRAGDFYVGRGRYYVNGLLCENEVGCLFSQQPHASPTLLRAGRHLIYLDVWERHITYLEDPSLREVALGGPDTTTRSQLVWTVKAGQLGLDEPYLPAFLKRFYWRTWLKRNWDQWLGTRQPTQIGYLKVQCGDGGERAQVAETPFSAGGFQGQENHLYRVEIHAGSPDQTGAPGGATFKWSRDNGSVVAALLRIDEDLSANTTAIYFDPHRASSQFDLLEGDWVEIVDDESVLQGRPGPLCQVLNLDRERMCVTVAGLRHSEIGVDPSKHPLLRRWDQKDDMAGGGVELIDGAVRVVEKIAENENWLVLEQGISVQFQPGGSYRSGDYWQFPARIGTQNVEWPTELDELGSPSPLAQPPGGIYHYFAPLAVVSMQRNGKLSITDLRRTFKPLR